ncbi:hypothetical protein KIPE111705_33955 [Kibdelosporangium persicum]|uniref:Uncharacterized protein n=1 Tax=Kibdelosporangium persicum TaxID=2698649 RepID=A0ABX2F859_9PSEU|nr:hypothetical protein [Kibdelosporangium persicum]NRN67539.1 hypothetical protein [Kibdelosporangium persicum]
MSSRSIRRKAAAVLGATVVGVAALASPASAGNTPIYANEAGASANGTVTWTSARSFADMDIRLTDMSCDQASVYFEIYVRYANGTEVEVGERHYEGGCGNTGYFNDISWTGGGTARLTDMRLKACTDHTGPNSCAWGPRVDNPYT